MLNTLILQNSFNGLTQEYHCMTTAGQTVLILNEDDVKRMTLADLEPSNDDDLFTYANHLLGEQFNAYQINHLEAEA